MKKIINGRMYNTATAKKLAYYSTGDGFSSMEEELYIKKTGEFFLMGGGSCWTKYAVYFADGSIGGGYKIEPLTVEEAKKWAEENISAEKYIDIFGEPEE